MKTVIIFISIIFLVSGCGLFDTNDQSGSIQVEFNSNTFKLCKEAGQDSTIIIQRVICVLQQEGILESFDDMSNQEGSYTIVINGLEIGGKYSISIYAETENSEHIKLAAFNEEIVIEDEAITQVSLTWHPFMPAMHYPEQNAILQNGNVILSCDPVPGAAQYRYILCQQIDSEDYKRDYYRIIRNVMIQSPAYELDETLPPGAYYYTVQCFGYMESYNSKISERIYFMIE